jgi:hypothetical protein
VPVVDPTRRPAVRILHERGRDVNLTDLERTAFWVGSGRDAVPDRSQNGASRGVAARQRQRQRQYLSSATTP